LSRNVTKPDSLKIRPISDFPKGRRIRVSLALFGSGDMARCAPPRRYPLAVGGVGGEDRPRDSHGKNSKSGSEKRSTQHSTVCEVAHYIFRIA
jgi:hypothetical protein